MNLLLDTHILIWLLKGDDRISHKGLDLVQDSNNGLFVSTISGWEISIKHHKNPGKMPLTGERLLAAAREIGCEIAHVDSSDVSAYDSLGIAQVQDIHRDPFDRMLIAQSKSKGMLLLTHDRQFLLYDEPLVIVI